MYFRASRTSPNELSGWYGEPAPARDTLDRIIKRGLVLNEYPDHSGIRITKHQQARIRCILLSLSNPGTDDRYLTYQSVLDWTNNTVENPYFSSARQWLLPESE